MKQFDVTSAVQGGGKRRDAGVKIITDLDQSTEFNAADNVAMHIPENLPTVTNSSVIFVLLCIFVFGGMAFAKFVERRKRK